MTTTKFLHTTLGALMLLLGTGATAWAAPLISGPSAAPLGDVAALAHVLQGYRQDTPSQRLAPTASPSEPGSRQGYAPIAQDLVHRVNLTEVPELDPNAAHSSLALLLGAVAIVVGRRVR